MIIGKNVKPSIPPVPGGTYMAVCVYTLGIGEQLCKYKDSTKYNRQFIIGFELVGQTVEVDGKEQPRTLNRIFNVAKGKNAGLRQFLEIWLGKALTDDEYMSFDTDTLLGKTAMLGVKLDSTGQYANIETIMQIPAGIPEPKATITPWWFDVGDGFDQEAFEQLPEWAQEKIKKSTDYQKLYAPETEVAVVPPPAASVTAVAPPREPVAQEECPI